jgi:hypothetical protein
MRTLSIVLVIALSSVGCKKKAADSAAGTGAASGSAPAAPTGKSDCDKFFALTDAFLKCDALPPPSKEGAMKYADAVRKRDGESKDEECKLGIDSLRKGAESVGCKIE